MTMKWSFSKNSFVKIHGKKFGSPNMTALYPNPCSLPITTPVSLLANEFDVRIVLHGQLNLAAVNQICVIHEAMNGFKNLKIY